MRAIQDRRTGGASLSRILIAVAFLALLIGYTIYHANFVLGRSMLFAFPDWEVTYRSAWPLWSGGATARDVTLTPPHGAEGGKFHFASLRIDVPFFEYYRSGFSRERGSLLNSIRNLRMQFDDGHGDLNYAFTQELNLFGGVSAAPFEAEGCMQDTVWLEEELGEMGLQTRGTQLVLAYQLENGRLIKRQTLNTPGAGRVDFRREMLKHDNFSLFSLVESGRSEVAADEWHVQDGGFVAARNRYCAGKDKVSTDEFVQRHLTSVKRLLESAGLAPQRELEAAYGAYASRGESFDLIVRYDPPIGAALYDQTDMGTWLPRLQGTFTADGKSHALAFSAVTPRPLPESTQVATTFELIQREGSAGPAGEIPQPASAITAAVAKSAPAQSASATSAAKALTTQATTSAQQPALDVPVNAPLTAHDGLTNYRQLASYVGRQLTVYRRGHAPVRVEILRIDEGNILVRRRLAGGSIEYVLDRNSFDHAEE